jgi:hypothetical protein
MLQEIADNYLAHGTCAEDALCKKQAEQIMRAHFSKILRNGEPLGALERAILAPAVTEDGGSFLTVIQTCQWILQRSEAEDSERPNLIPACRWIISQAEQAISEAKPRPHDN